MSYKIVRMFFDDDFPTQVIETGLTLEEAQAHCSDPETSSSTCTNDEGLKLTDVCGKWFDGYSEE